MNVGGTGGGGRGLNIFLRQHAFVAPYALYVASGWERTGAAAGKRTRRERGELAVEEGGGDWVSRRRRAAYGQGAWWGKKEETRARGKRERKLKEASARIDRLGHPCYNKPDRLLAGWLFSELLGWTDSRKLDEMNSKLTCQRCARLLVANRV